MFQMIKKPIIDKQTAGIICSVRKRGKLGMPHSLDFYAA